MSLWFDRRAGLALGVVTAGGTVGQAAVPPIFQALVSAHGWRVACALFAGGFVAVVLPAVALVRKPERRSPAALARPADPWPVPPMLAVALLSAAALFCCALMGVPTVHLVSYAAGEGLAPAQAARLVTLLMLSGAAGRVLTGAIVDRLGPLSTYALVSAVQTAAITLFPTVPAGPALAAVAVVYGFGFGGVMTALVCSIRAAVPARSVGTVMAVVGLLGWLGMGAGGFGGGLCFDRTGTYTLSFTMAGVAGLANLATLGTLAALVRCGRAPGPLAPAPIA